MSVITAETRALLERVEALPPAGTRVRLTHELWRYPHFIADEGMVGTVVERSYDLFAVRMDRRLEGAEEWANEIHWYPQNCDEWPEEEIEVLDRRGRFLSFLRNTLKGEGT